MWELGKVKRAQIQKLNPIQWVVPRGNHNQSTSVWAVHYDTLSLLPFFSYVTFKRTSPIYGFKNRNDQKIKKKSFGF